MKFVLNNVNIYNKNIVDKIDRLIDLKVDQFDEEKFYKIIIHYSSKGKDYKYSIYILEYLNAVKPVAKKRKEEDVESDALSIQADVIGDYFVSKGINLVEFSIGGEPTDVDMITIQMNECEKISDDFKIICIYPELTPEENERRIEETIRKLYNYFYKKQEYRIPRK